MTSVNPLTAIQANTLISMLLSDVIRGSIKINIIFR